MRRDAPDPNDRLMSFSVEGRKSRALPRSSWCVYRCWGGNWEGGGGMPNSKLNLRVSFSILNLISCFVVECSTVTLIECGSHPIPDFLNCGLSCDHLDKHTWFQMRPTCRCTVYKDVQITPWFTISMIFHEADRYSILTSTWSVHNSLANVDACKIVHHRWWIQWLSIILALLLIMLAFPTTVCQ